VEPLEVRRLLAAGDPDPSFGGGGSALVSFGPEIDTSRGQTLGDVDGDTRNGVTVVVADINQFQPGSDQTSRSDLAVVRLNASGRLDGSFSGDGKVVVRNFDAGDVLIQPDNKILIAGRVFRGAPAVLRLRANGTVDTSFGGGDGIATAGAALPHLSPFGAFASVALAPGGKIVAARWDDDDYAVVRLQPGGSLDRGFSGDGLASVGVPGIRPRASPTWPCCPRQGGDRRRCRKGRGREPLRPRHLPAHQRRRAGPRVPQRAPVPLPRPRGDAAGRCR
jgi:uncharacterized delta-60 repeat protein